MLLNRAAMHTPETGYTVLHSIPSISPHTIRARKATDSRRDDARAVLAWFADPPYVELVPHR